MSTVDVLIAGAGPAGLALARKVAMSGRSVTVLDGSPQAGSGSGLTLWPNAIAALHELGVDQVAAVARGCDGMRVSKPDGSTLQQLAAATMASACGGNGQAITRAGLLDQLRAALPPTVLLERAAVRSLAEVGPLVEVQTDRGPRTARVLVGADGAHSTVRASLAGAGAASDGIRRLGMRVIRGLSPITLPPYPAQVTMGRGVQFGIFALARGTYWFAAYPAGRATGSASETVLALFAGWHQPIGELIATTPPDRWLSHDVLDRKPPKQVWGSGRITLAGDAAHLAAPTMGQGTCHAFEDALALGNALAGSLEPQALRSYEAARTPRAAALVRRSHLAAVTGQWDGWAACAIRDLMMRSTPARAQARQLRSMFTFTAADVLAGTAPSYR